MKVCFETFGCRLNRAEALAEEAEYLANGWQLTERHSEANLIIVRGCSVTARAERDSLALVRHLRAHYPMTQLIVQGCIKETTKNKPTIPETPLKKSESATEAVPMRTARAYLKVQDGCNSKCTFCIVPQFRGLAKAVPAVEVLSRAQRFLEAGYRELVITGCNLAQYLDGECRLPELLEQLAKVAAKHSARIRLGSVEPGAVARQVVEVMADNANVCRFLHLPVQSGSNRILMAMRRPYLVREVDQIVDYARGRIPLLGLGCDLMTGFPNETELDFEQTASLLRRLEFNRAHVFPFSERPGTAAVALLGKVPRRISHARAHLLMAIARQNRTKFARSWIGKNAEIVVESDHHPSGWTSEYLWCEAYRCKPRRKELLTVRIASAIGELLKGEAQLGTF